MIPSYFMTIDSLPFSTSGKVDKSRLPDPLESIEAEREAFTPPKTETEKALAELWKSVLGIEQIDRSDSFFDIGGDSLSIVMVMARIPQQFHVEIMLEDVYKNPQLKRVCCADRCKAEKCAHQAYHTCAGAGGLPCFVAAAEDVDTAAERQLRALAYNIPMAFELEGDPDIARLAGYACKSLTERHDALRTVCRSVRDGKLRQKVLGIG